MLKSFFKLFSGNAAAQAIQLLALLFLTSLYIPDDFGKLGKIQSFASILSLFITLQMNHAIPLTKGDDKAEELTRTVFKISFLTFLLSFISLIFVDLDYTYGIILSLVLGLSNTINGYLIYKGNFSIISVLYIVRAIAIVSLQFLFYYLKIPDGLLYGALLGEFSGFLYLYAQNYSKVNFNFRIDFSVIKEKIIEWKSFSLHGTVQELLSAAIYALPMIFYTEKFSENIGGQYSIAFKVIYAPTVLVSSSLTQVLYHRFSQADGFKFLEKFVWFDKRFLILVALLLVLLFNIDFIDLAFLDGKWDIAIALLPYMFINAMFFLFASPYRIALRTLKLNKLILQVELITIVLMTALFLFIDIAVIEFTIIITAIGVIQNILITLNYKAYEKKNSKNS